MTYFSFIDQKSFLTDWLWSEKFPPLDRIDDAGEDDGEEDVSVEVAPLGDRARHDRRAGRRKRRLRKELSTQ